jgi:hypothetical protein
MRFLLAFALGLSVIAQTSKLDKSVEKTSPHRAENRTPKTKVNSAIQHPASSSAAPNQPDTQQQKTNAGNIPIDGRVYEIKVKEIPPDYWMRAYVLVTLLLAATSLGTLFYIRHQRDVMKDQLQAMREQLTEMKTAREQTVAEMKSAGEKTDALIQEAIKQANALTRQAAAAETAATAATKASQAALMNAQAVIKAERAWVCLDNIAPPSLTPYDAVSSNQMRRSYCIVRMKNFGNTPARVISVRMEMMLGIGSTPPPIAAFFAAPDTSTWDILPGDFPSNYEADLTNGFINSQELAEVNRSDKMLWVCGSIKYHDVFETAPENQHETRFCYLRETRTNAPAPYWTPAGPAEYNRST